MKVISKKQVPSVLPRKEKDLVPVPGRVPISDLEKYMAAFEGDTQPYEDSVSSANTLPSTGSPDHPYRVDPTRAEYLAEKKAAKKAKRALKRTLEEAK